MRASCDGSCFSGITDVADSHDDLVVGATAFSGTSRPHRSVHVGGVAEALEIGGSHTDDVIALAAKKDRLAWPVFVHGELAAEGQRYAARKNPAPIRCCVIPRAWSRANRFTLDEPSRTTVKSIDIAPSRRSSHVTPVCRGAISTADHGRETYRMRACQLCPVVMCCSRVRPLRPV